MQRKITKAEAEEFEKVFAPPTEEELYNSLREHALKFGSVAPKTITPEKRQWRAQPIDGCKPFEHFNEDWAVNEDGDLRGWGYYLISCDRLLEEDWLIHLIGKKQFDANTFIPAYIEACFRAGIQKVTMKMFY